MSLIEQNERKVLQERLQEAGTAQLSRIYLLATGDDATWVQMNPVISASVRVLGLVANDTQKLVIVCNELVTVFPNHATNNDLNAIASKLQAQIASQAIDPTQELWIGSEPMVNRTKLRLLLRDIVNGFHHGVVYVSGGHSSGRTHSFQLIRHVAHKHDISCRMVDFKVPIELRTVRHLYDELHGAYGLNVIDVPPSHVGATPGDVAGKFSSRLRSRLMAMHSANSKPWVVIDYTDEVPDPAVPEFLRMLCAARDASDFDNCVIFVLGPTVHLDTMRTELTNLQIEELSDVFEDDIHNCATAINQRGNNPLSTEDVQNRVVGIYASAQAQPENARMAGVRRALLELRREVRAP